MRTGLDAREAQRNAGVTRDVGVGRLVGKARAVGRIEYERRRLRAETLKRRGPARSNEAIGGDCPDLPSG